MLVKMVAVRQWPHCFLALRAGFAAYLATTLLITTVFTAYWASHSEFPGHSHPPGTPDHVHQMHEVGLSGTLALVLTVVIIALPVVAVAIVRLLNPVVQVLRVRVDCARAPPAASFS